jgi:PKHD-type hydroxylase
MSRSIYLYPKERMGVTYPYVYWDGLFTDEELELVKGYCDTLELDTASTVGKNGEMDFENPARKSDIAWIRPNDENMWIFERFTWVIEKLNDRFYEFNLNGFEVIQYTVYNEDGQQRYDLHMDTILGTDKSMDLPETRKLSLSMVLSDPSEYEGGQFQMQTGSPEEDKLMTVEQLKGRVIGFPSFLLHRVTPVTKGIRKSLVIWVEGPKFK